MELLIGTTNPGKLREYAAMLAELPLKLVSLRDVGLEAIEIDEPFPSYEDNALHKARQYARLSGLLSLADDSGLEVAALGGRPGVHSARYGGLTDRDRYLKLLAELDALGAVDRSAVFVCVTAVAHPDGRVETARGICRGAIAAAPGEGTTGFGYDAVFIAEGYDRTLNALSQEEKDRISHRGRAARAIIPALRRLASL